MTVAKLIEELKKQDPELEVHCVNGVIHSVIEASSSMLKPWVLLIDNGPSGEY
jgi:hypothetical protein